MAQWSIILHGYALPVGVGAGGLTAQWVAELTPKERAAIDRGDPLGLPREQQVYPMPVDQPNDHRLGRVEIGQGLMDEYERLTRTAVTVGLGKDWVTWERVMARKDVLAATIREVGWEPAFHIASREYHRRILDLLQWDLNSGSMPEAFTASYDAAFAGWEAGGLCLAYPAGRAHVPDGQTAEAAVAACQADDRRQWGECVQTSYKVMTLAAGAAAVYGDPTARPLWVNVDIPLTPERCVALGEHPGCDIGHSFILFLTAFEGIALDPSGVGLIASTDPHLLPAWRGAIAAHYTIAAGLALRKGKWADVLEASRKCVILDPTDSLSYTYLGTSLLLSGRHGEAVAALRQALIFPPNDASTHHNLSAALLELGKYR